MKSDIHSHTSAQRGFFRALGPAIIVACVVLGPGSILTSSKVGTEHGYGLLWVLLLAMILMMAMVGLSARLGVALPGTLCEELARRMGRGVSVFVGLTIFLIAACFQFGNNMAIVAALDALFGMTPVSPDANAESGSQSSLLPIVLLVGLNGLVVAVLFGLHRLYKPIERLMMVLVGIMLIAFAGNLLFEMPSLPDLFAGFLPQLPESARDGLFPYESEGGGIVDPLGAMTGMFATTFSVAGAFYQSYLVREKGWSIENVGQSVTDSIAGIAVLGFISMLILATAATALHGEVRPDALDDLSDVATQLKALFGPAANVLFALGIFAGAFSSILVNAMIGGTMLADGLGWGGKMDRLPTKLFTTLGMGVGVVMAGYIYWQGDRPVGVIVFAQALTVIGLPILALTLIYLGTRPELTGKYRVPRFLLTLAGLGSAIALFLAIRTGWTLILKLT